MKTKEAPQGANSRVRPVTVTFTGPLAEIIREKAKSHGRKPSEVAEWFCETGCDRPMDGGKRLFVEIDENLRSSLERLIEVSSYGYDANELALDTQINRVAVLEAVAMTLIRHHECSDLRRIRKIAQVAMEEKIRHSLNPADEWISKHTLGMEVPR